MSNPHFPVTNGFGTDGFDSDVAVAVAADVVVAVAAAVHTVAAPAIILHVARESTRQGWRLEQICQVSRTSVTWIGFQALCLHDCKKNENVQTEIKFTG